jgi:hypothetical protein
MIKFSREKVLLLHKILAEATGGAVGVRDEGLLDSALEGAFAGFGDREFYPSKEEKGARLGYTLISNSRGLRLLQHQKIADVREALRENKDIESVSETVELQTCRTTLGDTDEGRLIQDEITDLYNLLLAYQNGLIKPQE